MPECLTTSFEAAQPLASLRSIKMPKASAMDWNLRVRSNSGGFGKQLKVKLGDLTFYWKDFWKNWNINIYIYVYILSLPNVGRPLMDCQSYGVSIALPVRLATLVRSNFGAFHLVQSPGVTFNGLRFHHDHDGSGSRWLAHQGPVETGRNAELAAARSQCAWSGADHQLHSSLVSIFGEARPNAGWIGIGLDVSSSFGSLWLMVQYFRLLVEVGYNNVYIYI